MAVLKKKLKDKNFVTISNELAQSKNLSYEARGLLLELLSRPENWIIHKSQLVRADTGKTKLNRIIQELKKENHLRVETIRENGKIVDREWVACEEPFMKILEKNTKGSTPKKKKAKDQYGEFKNVFLTDEEHNKLITSFGDSFVKQKIQDLSEYIKIKNPKYKDHYLVLRKWCNKDKKETEDQPRGKPVGNGTRVYG